jgi:hypothetical protein
MDLCWGKWVGAGTQQFPGAQVVEHQRGRFDSDPYSSAAEDFYSQELVAGQRGMPETGYAAFDLHGVAIFDSVAAETLRRCSHPERPASQDRSRTGESGRS